MGHPTSPQGNCNMKMKHKLTTVSPCIFKRTEDSSEERGICIGNGEIIIDRDFKPVKAPIWNYTILYHAGVLPIAL